MKNPKNMNLIKTGYIWTIYFFAIIFSTSCNETKNNFPNFEISIEERKWLTDFFNHLLFFESGIYTLWGSSKPITCVIIEKFTEDEYRAYKNSLTEKEKTNTFSIDNNFEENWEKWKAISHRFPMKRFMLFESHLYNEPDVTIIIFVDIIKTAMVIQENYNEFRKLMGFDFNPLEVTLEIQNENSLFWQKTKENALISGLLYGYGKTNSYLFNWRHFETSLPCKSFCEKLPTFYSNNINQIRGRVEFNVDNFFVPSFISFTENDEVVESYKREKLMIQKNYDGHDFLDLTFRKLTN